MRPAIAQNQAIRASQKWPAALLWIEPQYGTHACEMTRGMARSELDVRICLRWFSTLQERADHGNPEIWVLRNTLQLCRKCIQTDVSQQVAAETALHAVKTTHGILQPFETERFRVLLQLLHQVHVSDEFRGTPLDQEKIFEQA